VYDACCFDYGNTLIRFDRPEIRFIEDRFVPVLAETFGPLTVEAFGRAMDRLYEMPRRGLEPTYRELESAEQMAILLDDLYGPGSRPTDALERTDAALQDIFVESIRIDPGDKAVLERMAVRIPLALVSNYPCGGAIRRSLEGIGIDRLFKTIVISGEVGFVKPHPSLFRKALEGLGSDPGRTLFVGDRWDADLCGARDAGLRTCHMVGFTPDADFEASYASYRPDHVVRTLEEVAAILGVQA
jgi:HAD superfamily hydrolase (TIGR01549 family)